MRRIVWAAAVLCAAAACARAARAADDVATAIFSGGCFWCIEAAMEKVPGVISVETGYTGGGEPDPTYADVAAQKTGHRAAVRVLYDPKATDYRTLLRTYWLNVDPLDAGGQFCDRGASWTTAIYASDETQRAEAEAYKAMVARLLGQPVATEILPVEEFWPAEERQQDYAAKNPLRYDFYLRSCGRSQRLRQVWAAPRGQAVYRTSPR